MPDSHSLKEKRAVLKPILEGTRRRFAVASAEVGHQDSWQRARLGIAAVAGTPSQVEAVLDGCERFVWSRPGIEVLAMQRHWLDMEP
ncbi:MAG TPA: DUF503 domain-containing protein [Acidimicrobiales bacterium]|nr:DUF503 domain-containing protein [Acidimicrobiales bacterium]